MAAERTFRYILRYGIDPAYHAEDRIEELLALCAEARIEEVMLFLAAEELNPGHATREQLAPYVAMGVRLKERLAERGIAFSLNPWTTVHHASAGRRLQGGQDFTQMVGETGAVNPVAACPLCPHWQAYLCDVFAYLARELEPTVLWVEDDWRLHNHDAELGFGGCFCQRHMDAMSEAVGQPVTREQVLDAVCSPGEPHPWRAIWLQICRESLLAPAGRLHEAVAAASPGTRLALMTSVPDVHAAEGRDWPALQRALGDAPAFLCRPHLPPYEEAPAIRYPPTVARHTLACLAGPLEIYPELDTRRGGPYSRSRAFAAWQCLQAAAIGSDGITINHFDMMGCGTATDRRFGETFAGLKDRLNAIAALNVSDRDAEGVRVLFSPQVAAVCRSTRAGSLNGLCTPSVLWSDVLQILGIAHGLSAEVLGDGRPHAVGNQTLRALDDETIRRLLAGPLLLDAVSVEILLERGFGEWIGIESAAWRTPADTPLAYESICQEDASVYGLPRPRMTVQHAARRLLSVEAGPGAVVRSQVRRYDHAVLFPGAVTYRNAAGGSVCSLAYPLDGGSEEFFMGFFGTFRRRLLQRLVFELAPRAPLAAVEEDALQVHRLRCEAGLLLAVLNPLADAAERFTLRVPTGQIDARRLEQLGRDGTWAPASARVQREGEVDRIEIGTTVAPLDGVFLLARQKERSAR